MSRPVGVDISKHQGNNLATHPDDHGVNFTLLHNKAEFIILRAGYGGSAGGAWLDERVHQFMHDLGPLLRQEPKPFTFYWYFRDDVNVMDQVNLFSSVINKYKNYVNLPPVVDAEVFVKSDLLSTQKIKDFQAEVENQTGLLVDILYGRGGQLNAETTPGLPEVLPHLWIARYGDFDPQEDEPWVEGSGEYTEPRDYDKWDFWQYSSKGPGSQYGVISASIDENVYNGTLEELREWAGLHEPVPPPPDWVDGLLVDERVVSVEPGQNVVVFDLSDAVPEELALQFDRETVNSFVVNVKIGTSYVRLHKVHCRYREWASYALPNWIGKGPYVLVVEIDALEAAPVVVQLVSQEW